MREEGDFTVHGSVYGKVQAEDGVKPNHQERKGKRKMLVLTRAGLYVDYMPYVSLSRLGGGIDPTTIDYWDYSTYILPEIT